MLTPSRSGPIVWISEVDAKKAGIVDKDRIEFYNLNGALAVRAVVSQGCATRHVPHVQRTGEDSERARQ